MKKKWTRRNFLRTSLGSSLAASATLGGATAAGHETQAPSSSLSAAQRATLLAAMDEIIPAADGMPSASAVGGVDYVLRVAQEDATLRGAVKASVAAIEALSKKNCRKQFASLTSEQRVESLRLCERQSPEEFAALRDLIYEAYYTEPRVWKLIGYELHPTNEAGPRVKPFDEAALAQVRRMPKRYRAT